jgi:murein DD-endopeptidase MepM/ murein hydrolase activator NlpD
MRRRSFQIAAAAVMTLCFAAPAAALHNGPTGVRSTQHSLARTFEWPAHGTITTLFTRHHPGLDIGMLRSLSIRAAAAGRVERVGYATGFEGYGEIVEVQIAPHVITLYAHLSSYRVHPGERVRMGQRLGTAGCTGYCTGTHLHFEVRENGVAVNPRYFLR